MVKLIFYTRQNCHLCAVAKAVVCEVQQYHDFQVEIRNVDDHPDWIRAYGDEVPVGIIGDRKVFKYRVKEDQLRLAILAS
jgi:hypothetical protein|tara:strand:- start:102 stop:341 length:240 start_codon:yes stop_codon:yes gene_type:complete